MEGGYFRYQFSAFLLGGSEDCDFKIVSGDVNPIWQGNQFKSYKLQTSPQISFGAQNQIPVLPRFY